MSAKAIEKETQSRSGLVIAEQNATSLAVTGESSAILSMIERASRDESVDIEKMERLMAMYERNSAKQAEIAFYAALSAMQPELPVVTENGKVKNKAGGVQSTYALWEDINEAIKPVLKNFGFALSFLTDSKAGVTVTGILSHSTGHSIRTEILLPVDTSGSKNNVQAVASSVSYGKRYTAGALLNLTSRGEDDDGAGAGAGSAEGRHNEKNNNRKRGQLIQQRFENALVQVRSGQFPWERLANEYDLTDSQRKALQAVVHQMGNQQ